MLKLAPKTFDKKFSGPKLFQIERTRRLAHLPSFCELVPLWTTYCHWLLKKIYESSLTFNVDHLLCLPKKCPHLRRWKISRRNPPRPVQCSPFFQGGPSCPLVSSRASNHASPLSDPWWGLNYPPPIPHLHTILQYQYHTESRMCIINCIT